MNVKSPSVAAVFILILALSFVISPQLSAWFTYQNHLEPNDYLSSPARGIGQTSVSMSLQPGDASTLLSICPDGISFCEGGQAVILRGANAPHLIWGESPGSWQWAGLDRLKEDIRDLRSWGGNFVVINFDPGRVENSRYAEEIVEAVQFAHEIGLHVELMQHHSRWIVQNGKPVFTPLAVTDTNDDQRTDVDQRWMQLLSHPGVAESLSASVDIFGIFSEPDQMVKIKFPIKITSAISWPDWRVRAEKACQDIRLQIKRQAICSISGVHWAWDVSRYRSDPFQIPAVALEVHQYQHLENKPGLFQLDRSSNWKTVIGKVPVIMGEFGHDDPPGYVRDLVSDLESNQVSWAAWSLIGWGPDQGMIDRQTRKVLPLGEIVKSTISAASHP